ncbi:MAG: hypothetical protein KF681_05125 [Bdellovibrionaceae bacterium]|nr:hypothetical protein [Pseudobdellovibrionaceae bacterium]
MKSVLMLSLIVILAGCATMHPGAKGHQVQGSAQALVVSANPVPEYSDKSNVFIDFTFENQGTRWLRIDQVKIEFPNKTNAAHNVIVGDDLKIWAESYKNKRKLSQHNSDLGIASLILSGAGIAIAGTRSNNGGFESVGLAGVGAGATWSAARSMRDSQRAAQTSEIVPENYVLAPITIPSQGFLRRWVLVNIPTEMIAKHALLTLTTVEGDVLKYEIPIQF